MAYTDIDTVKRKTGLSYVEAPSTTVTAFIAEADAEIDATTGQGYTSTISSTEYFNIYPPKRVDDLDPNRILLKHYPVSSINSFTLLDTSGNATTTFVTITSTQIANHAYVNSQYYCEPETGLIELTTQSFDYVPRKARIAYTYGYGTVPSIVNELSACLAGIRTWTNFLGGNYDRLNSYNVPEQSYNKGAFYARGKQIIEDLTKRAEYLFNQLIKKQRSQFFATSGGYF